METTKYCAFNKSRETFLTLDARVLDAAVDPLKVLKVLIEGLDADTRTGLWLTNFKAIPVARTLSPFDLIYLDEDHRVVHAVELTTDGAFEPFNGEPASAFVLPPSTISSTQTRAGDQLIVVATPEAKPKPLAETAPAGLAVPPQSSSISEPLPQSIFRDSSVQPSTPVAQTQSDSAPLDNFLKAQSQDSPQHASSPPVSQPAFSPLTSEKIASLKHPPPDLPITAPVNDLRRSFLVEAKAAEAQPSAQPLPTPPAIQPAPATAKPAILTPQSNSFKSRMHEWLFPVQGSTKPRRARDRRRAHRIPMPDLVAYFWTGGAPRPHRISNISITGFYMQTDDLWMPGTIMRMTLQKMGTRGDNPGDSVTVHSKIVRHGDDGGGFEFVLSGFLDRNLPNPQRPRQISR